MSPNPFFKPADATRESAAHVAEAAKQINPQLAAGQRVFHVPIGIAPAIADALAGAGWMVVQKDHATDKDGAATLVLTDPTSSPRTAPQITATFMWTQHRAVLRGKSAVNGADLPETLAECPAGVQAAHYGLALAAARLYEMPEPAVPEGMSEEDAYRVQRAVAIARMS